MTKKYLQQKMSTFLTAPDSANIVPSTSQAIGEGAGQESLTKLYNNKAARRGGGCDSVDDVLTS